MQSEALAVPHLVPVYVLYLYVVPFWQLLQLMARQSTDYIKTHSGVVK